MSFDKVAYEQERRLQEGATPFKLKASVQTYELTLADLAELIANNLGVPKQRITITDRKKDMSGPMDRNLNYVFDGLVVTVKND